MVVSYSKNFGLKQSTKVFSSESAFQASSEAPGFTEFVMKHTCQDGVSDASDTCIYISRGVAQVFAHECDYRWLSSRHS